MLIRAYQGKEPRFGERVFVAENAVVIGDVELGDDASIWYGTVVRGDVFHIRIGARTNIQDHCVLHVTTDTWPTIVGEEVTIGHGVIAHGCTIERRSLIGIGSRILDGAVIGEESIVAAGSIVTPRTKIPPRSLVMGTPGRVMRSVTAEEIEHLAQSSRNYVEYKNQYLQG
jgi:carbonic anhydrase/acetyltransferase-like protein (isoleucine patch superfamily)